MKNRVHTLLDKHGLSIPYKAPFSMKAVRWMSERSRGFMDDAILRSDLALLEVLNEQVGYVEKKLVALSVDDASVRLLRALAELMQIPSFRAHLS